MQVVEEYIYIYTIWSRLTSMKYDIINVLLIKKIVRMEK